MLGEGKGWGVELDRGRAGSRGKERGGLSLSDLDGDMGNGTGLFHFVWLENSVREGSGR